MQGDLKATVEAKKDERSSELQPKWWGETLGLYVHVPFCATACDFCAFYQVTGDRAGIKAYLRGVKREVERLAAGRRLDTCFFGGGTPGLLMAGDLAQLCETVTATFGVAPAEWTVEMAPSTVKADKLAALKERGVTRISMGVQSFDDTLLDKLGRQHSRKQIFKAYDLIQAAEFESVNLDLMFALPGQDAAQSEADIREAASLEPDHLSTYCLTFEEDTALYARLSKGKVKRDSDLEAKLYESCWETLAELGYAQYEVSNYARPGMRCAHNLNTWKMDQWIGLGPSAASQFGGRRFSNVPDLDRWLAGLERERPERVDCSETTRELLREDALIFGLRMNEGVSVERLRERFGISLSEEQESVLRRLENEGKLVRDGASIRVTNAGRLVVDAIGSELMGLG